VGENGAGKSTLAKVILGVYRPDNGMIFLKDKAVHFHTPLDGIKNKIIAVYQEFTLVPYLNVAQNIFLNREYRNKTGLVDHKRMQKEAVELLHKLKCDYIDVKSPVKKLSVAEQQMVEIAKALSFKPEIIVFDEPTATLTDREVASLFEQIHILKNQGIGIIYVSHRMQEFQHIGDRITVMRDGKKIATVGINECSTTELVNMMVGRDISQVYVRTKNNFSGPAIEVQNLSDRAGRVKNVSLHVERGEIVGIAGLVGSGRTETVQSVFGIRKIRGGVISVKGAAVSPRNPNQMIKLGIGLVPEDRKRQGLAISESVAWNILGASLKQYFPHFMINFKKVQDIAEQFKRQLRIATPDVHKLCKQLSGGNQQKVVLAKWLSRDPEVLIFDEPTRGIDVGAKMEIYGILNQLASSGKAILMISSELPEVIGMSDRIYIMHDGEIVDECVRGSSDFNAEAIGAKMLGVDKITEAAV
ncbi:MAG: sugar ABC transporter ATP-binding protein, partial [Treponema sp.]|jgi:ABC-type sugar transport system ATPase subunit|nr:sugar ABC transporter ATP-binding protein [Treponema sp.]